MATMSNGRIAICCCLLRFANRAANKATRNERSAAAARDHDRQSSWRPAGRELGIGTIKERPGSSQFECCGQDADWTRGRTEWRPNRGLLRFARVCKSGRAGAGLWSSRRSSPRMSRTPRSSLSSVVSEGAAPSATACWPRFAADEAVSPFGNARSQRPTASTFSQPKAAEECEHVLPTPTIAGIAVPSGFKSHRDFPFPRRRRGHVASRHSRCQTA
jgi:hypothetical protein